MIAPSLIPTKPGTQRKHDKHDAVQLARLYRSGELTPVRIPTEAEERVRDLVRCRTTFQREVLKSRHYILKFLARRGFVYREGTNWSSKHLVWLRHLASSNSPLAHEDALVYSAETLGGSDPRISQGLWLACNQMATIHREGGFSFRVFPNDHPPAHVHALGARRVCRN